ncbi:UDP-N-acetylglucosamine 4,6-dehydratase (inverting) [Gammaproteobacteria bacterium]|jgi:UDP-N-acetylglucosamine 4,6-dehydratase/5-epimerase|nr:UDP-N-acetylglucosamine 4,6-dehydratase (inverting) [Gammaproteobacteria bacterium]
MLNGKNILLSGGTGSFGKAFIKHCVKKFPDINRLIIFSRDELKQHEMQQEFSDQEIPFLRYFIGDIRDQQRLNRAMEDVDIVVHAAALKHVSVAEYNPMEFINTNVLGTQNLINAALDHSIESFVALSTDKASSPTNLYGATKLCADKLVTAANNIRGSRNTKFSVVRYGNVFGSRGSIVPLFEEQAKNNKLTITDESMTRFNISLQNGVEMVLWALKNSFGGEILVPKIPSYKIMDMAAAFGQDIEIDTIGIRPGEKLHEEMISISDSLNSIQFDDYYAILPSGKKAILDYYLSNFNAKKLKEGFSYTSDTNEAFLTISELKKLLSDYRLAK